MEPEEQLAREFEYKERISAGDASLTFKEPLFLARLWTDFDPNAHRKQRGGQKRGARGALHRAVMLLDQGFMPPLETLLVIADCYRSYLASGGKVSLEEAMGGKPTQRIGTVAAQIGRGELQADMSFTFEFIKARHGGEADSDNEAAKLAQTRTERKLGHSPDAESWLRHRRRKRDEADKNR